MRTASWRGALRALPQAIVLAAAMAACGEVGSKRVPAVLSSDALSAPVLIAVGDIASCASSGDEATARLVDTLPGLVAVLGDNAYQNGTDGDYARCYEPSWGRHKPRTRPTPGNHEYRTAGAGGYFRYFGAVAGKRDEGYYSYDLAGWHVVVLNSNSNCVDVRCDAASPQVKWLRADLAAHPSRCTLAYWHHPRFNSGAHHGGNDRVEPFWDALYEAGVDVVLNGHEHLYERFSPQRPDGTADTARGIVQFTVGTGGRSHYEFGRTTRNSVVRAAEVDGVLRLDLAEDGYRWRFIAASGATFADAGEGRCH